MKSMIVRTFVPVTIVVAMFALFQNCSLPNFSPSNAVGGNGDIYSGMIYVSRAQSAAPCADRSDIKSAIHGSRKQGFVLIRKDCAPVPPRTLAASEVDVVDGTQIRFSSETFVARDPSASGWLWTITCTGQDVPGSFVDIPTTNNSAHRIEMNAYEQLGGTAKVIASGEILYLDSAGSTLMNVPISGITFTGPAPLPQGPIAIGNASVYPIETMHLQGVVPPAEYANPLSFLGRFNVSGDSVALDSLYFLGTSLQRQFYTPPARELRSLRIYETDENPSLQVPWTTQCLLMRRF